MPARVKSVRPGKSWPAGPQTLPRLAELIYGKYTPATGWAVWQLVADGLYFRGTPSEVAVATPAELAGRVAAREADAVEHSNWEGFLKRARGWQTGA